MTLKNIPNILNGTKIKLDSDSKFDIPQKYSNMFLILKKDFNKIKKNLKYSPVYPILKNENNKILDFDTYTIDTKEDYDILQKNITKRYLRNKDNNDEFIFAPDIIGILTPIDDIIGVLTPIHTTGGKKHIKKYIRKHKGIIQTGCNSGRLRKGYKFCGKQLKNGLPKILKI